MSGDVQPRKRKDKKRRKDETEQEPIKTSAPILTNATPNDDQNIHVHKEGGTGGGICAKLVFFILFSALSILIGLIITEHRGLTDVEVVERNSKFAQIFEGWIDSPSEHLEHDVHEGFDHDEHDDDEDLAQDSDEHDDDEHEDEEDDAEPDLDEDESKEEDELTEEVSNEDDEDNDNQDDTEEDASEEQDEDEEDEDEEDNTYEVSTERRLSIEDEDEDDDTDDDKSDETLEDRYADDDDEQEEEKDDDNDDYEKKDEDEQEDDDYYEKGMPVKRSAEDKDDHDDQDDDNNQVRPEKIVASGEAKKVEPEDEVQQSSGTSDGPGSKEAPGAYEHGNITSKEDFKIKDEIDEAQKFAENNPAYAVQLFDKILEKYPSSPRSLYGKAIALDNLSDQRKSNEILYKALDLYTRILMTDNVPETLVKVASERCIRRMRFVGQYWKLVDVQKALIEKFPTDPKHRNDLVITYLMMNRIEPARSILIETLKKWPDNGVALVHYGFILKTTDNRLQEAVRYLRKGLRTNDEGVVDGRFYFHLGDALARLGKRDEAMEVYEQGTDRKVFLSKYQRSLYNVDRLSSKPFWDPRDLPFADLFGYLRQYWKKIRDEGLSVLDEQGYFRDEAENLRDTGEWKQFELYVRGQKNAKNCRKTPFTCSIIDRIPDVRGCKRGQTKFSVMHPGTHVWPHCGPTNCRLRIHLGLKVPPDTFLRVATEIRSWKEGEILAFDDSFEHEVWHNGTQLRLVLIVDVWHPELTATEKKNLSPI